MTQLNLNSTSAKINFINLHTEFQTSCVFCIYQWRVINLFIHRTTNFYRSIVFLAFFVFHLLIFDFRYLSVAMLLYKYLIASYVGERQQCNFNCAAMISMNTEMVCLDKHTSEPPTCFKYKKTHLLNEKFSRFQMTVT